MARCVIPAEKRLSQSSETANFGFKPTGGGKKSLNSSARPSVPLTASTPPLNCTRLYCEKSEKTTEGCYMDPEGAMVEDPRDNPIGPGQGEQPTAQPK